MRDAITFWMVGGGSKSLTSAEHFFSACEAAVTNRTVLIRANARVQCVHILTLRAPRNSTSSKRTQRMENSGHQSECFAEQRVRPKRCIGRSVYSALFVDSVEGQFFCSRGLVLLKLGEKAFVRQIERVGVLPVVVSNFRQTLDHI